MKLDALLQQLGNEDQINQFPLDQWTPEHCGDIDIRIAKDGTWWHEGGRIRRERLVRLFSALLICEDDEYFLITPAEKARIQVEDAAPTVCRSAIWSGAAPSTDAISWSRRKRWTRGPRRKP